MPTAPEKLIGLEKKFWQSMVDDDVDAALELLCEPALMVSEQGSMKFDHAGYRRMAEQGPMVLKSFELRDMEVVFPNEATAVLAYRVRQGVAPRGDGTSVEREMHDTSTWIRKNRRWQCVIHTETPVAGDA